MWICNPRGLQIPCCVVQDLEIRTNGKINYTHNNPVEAGFVENDYEYLYSSARDYCGTKGLVTVLTA